MLFDVIAGWLNRGKATFSTPAVAGDVVYVGSADGHMYGLDLFTGTVLWDFDFGTPVSSSPALSGNMLFVGASDGHLYAFSGSMEGVSPVEDPLPQDQQFRFAPPQPNPFGHSCFFQFSLGKNTGVSLKVFDVRGRLVKRIVDETLLAGQHIYEWHGVDEFQRPVGAGVYFAVIETGGTRQVRKLVHTK